MQALINGDLDAFIAQLRNGYALVMGNRFDGGIKPGAMPPLHRYLGNPVLTAVGRLFFRSPCGDFHCGLRGFDKEAILALDPHAPGMEFASEMVVKATIHGLRITEVPTTPRWAPSSSNRSSTNDVAQRTQRLNLGAANLKLHLA